MLALEKKRRREMVKKKKNFGTFKSDVSSIAAAV